MSSSLPPSLPERFRLLGPLFEEMGPSAFLAEDRLSPDSRCVLTVSADELTEEARRDELERIRALVKLRHPRLTPVVAARLDESEGPPFFVVERPEGIPLLRRVAEVRARQGGAAAHALVRRTLFGLASALEYLRRRGVLHYDLRPGRILLDAHDEATIVGFGLAAPQLEDSGQSPESLAYSAPEILRGDPVDHRADLYSLGVLLYEALTGRNPFLGADATETARAHLELVPPAPSVVDPAVPRDLDETVMLLLAKNPSRSFASAADVVAALEPRRATGRRRPPPLSPFAFTQNEFVGRKHEQRRLRARFRLALEGRGSGRPIVLLGPAGVGKTRLLAELRQSVRLAGGAYLEGSPREETPRQLAGLAAALRRAADLRSDEPRLVAEADAWLRGAREREALAPAASGTAARRTADPENLGRRAAHLLARAAERIPLVVAFDDADRLGALGAPVLDAMLRCLAAPDAPPGAPHLLVCLAIRDGVEVPEALRRHLQPAPSGSIVLRLKELTRAELASFVSSVFGPGSDAAPLVELLARTAGGNPFLLEETIRSWIARGLVRWSEGLRIADAERVRATPPDLRTLVQERLRNLPPASERWLRLAALLGRPLTRRRIAALEASAGAPADPAIEDLLQRGFLRRFVRGGEERFEVAHALLADAVVHAAGPTARRELHRALAGALEEIEPGTPADLFEIARHRLRGGEALRGARTLLASGSLLVPLEGTGELQLLLAELADELPAHAAERTSCLRWLGEARLAAGDPRGARSAIEAAHGSASARGDAAEASRLEERLAEVLRRQGDERGARRLLIRALRGDASRGDRLRRAAILARIASIDAERGTLRRAVRSLRLARALLKGIAAPVPREAGRAEAEARIAAARVARVRGDVERAERELRRAARAMHDAGARRFRSEWLLERARIAVERGDFPAARRRAREAAESARNASEAPSAAALRLELARIRSVRGDHGAAAEDVRSVLAELRRTRSRATDALSLRAHLASQEGHHSRAMRLFAAAEAAGRGTEPPGSRLERAHAKVLDRLGAGDARGALLATREEMTLARRSGAAPWIARARVDAAEGMRERGRPAAARRLYARALAALRRHRRSFAESPFRARLGLVRLELAAGRTDRALRHLGKASRLFLRLRRFPELADLRAARGEAALVTGRADEAERSFRAALRIDDRLGRPFERADDLQGLARAALLAGRLDAARARALLAEDGLAAIRLEPQGASVPGENLREKIGTVKAEVAERRGRAERRGDAELLRALVMLQREAVEGRGSPRVARRLAQLAAETLAADRAYVLLDRRGGVELLGASDRRGLAPDVDAETLARARRGSMARDRASSVFTRRVWLSEPLLDRGTEIGALVVESPALERRFDEADRQALRTMATVASVVVGAGAEPSARSPETARTAALVDLPELRLVGESPVIRRLRRTIERAAASGTPVLVRGETGTGKELVARCIHAAGGAGRPLVVLSCASLPASLVEAELFGHERGAFTGADSERVGLLERADRGTLVLDGVEDLDPLAQRALLRTLESGEFRRVGGSVPRRVRFRAIALTAVDPEAAVRRGSLRADLYYRVAGIRLELAPLRERREDILPLIEHFLATSEPSATKPRLTPSAIRTLLEAPWPGNVRELRAAVSRWQAEGLRLVRRSDLTAHEPDLRTRAIGGLFSRRIEDFEREAILEALKRSGGRAAIAARWLRMPRSTFYWKLRALGLERPGSS